MALAAEAYGVRIGPDSDPMWGRVDSWPYATFGPPMPQPE
ncbi:hypothetical protein CLV92_11937 [Kineococcus xinjiangensis]|uniref:Uncharacterized protein n=1 Tax=Kineococcus xinjiangensis TaxID=512762 RepID=A0A2S6ICM2_9ACTN|nr:hypothetical protein CLV92_11937 [Kineococcus xinjiangensis]